jgi:hypothetical protein
MSVERRLERLEQQYIWQIVTDTAQEYGVPIDELLDETRRFFALTDDEQDAKLAASLAEAEARGDHEAVRILTHGWAAVRSYR